MKIQLSKRAPVITQGSPVLDEEMKQAALDALENDKYTMGENVFKFEQEFAQYIGTKYAVATNSGTAALHIALLALGLQPGDEVVTTPMSFIATANSIVYVGGIPKFADVRRDDYNIDSALVNKVVSEKTKALLPVHLYGHPADLDALLETCASRDLSLVEDACQAHGAMYKGRKIGTIGNVGCFSFYPSKNLSVLGDGGMAVTGDKDLADMMAKLRDCGRISHYEHDEVGYSYRLGSLSAAVGRVQLRRVDEWNSRRRQSAETYYNLLRGITEIQLPPRSDSEIQSVYHQFVILTKNRGKLKKWLEERNIQCGIHYPVPIHIQPVYRRLYGYRGGEFPVSEEISRNCLSLPMHPLLSADDLSYICEQIRSFFANGS